MAPFFSAISNLPSSPPSKDLCKLLFVSPLQVFRLPAYLSLVRSNPAQVSVEIYFQIILLSIFKSCQLLFLPVMSCSFPLQCILSFNCMHDFVNVQLNCVPTKKYLVYSGHQCYLLNYLLNLILWEMLVFNKQREVSELMNYGSFLHNKRTFFCSQCLDLVISCAVVMCSVSAVQGPLVFLCSTAQVCGA